MTAVSPKSGRTAITPDVIGLVSRPGELGVGTGATLLVANEQKGIYSPRTVTDGGRFERAGSALARA